jgi:hypothetical protein
MEPKLKAELAQGIPVQAPESLVEKSEDWSIDE